VESQSEAMGSQGQRRFTAPLTSLRLFALGRMTYRGQMSVAQCQIFIAYVSTAHIQCRVNKFVQVTNYDITVKFVG